MTGTTRERLAMRLIELMRDLTAVEDDTDMTKEARQDCQRLWAALSVALDGFNRPTGSDPWSDGGPTGADLAGEVQHDVG
jgi:hypothetical protein